jgi:hypothetical protein
VQLHVNNNDEEPAQDEAQVVAGDENALHVMFLKPPSVYQIRPGLSTSKPGNLRRKTA